MAKKIKKTTARKQTRTAAPKQRGEGVDFVKSLALRFIRMVDSSSELVIIGNQFPTQLTIKTTSGHSTREEGSLNIIGAHMTVEVLGIPEGEDASEESSHLLITANFEVQYSSEFQPTEDELRVVVGLGVLAGWPNAREFVLSTSARMGVPPVLLPMAFVNPQTGQIAILSPPNAPPIQS